MGGASHPKNIPEVSDGIILGVANPSCRCAYILFLVWLSLPGYNLLHLEITPSSYSVDIPWVTKCCSCSVRLSEHSQEWRTTTSDWAALFWLVGLLFDLHASILLAGGLWVPVWERPNLLGYTNKTGRQTRTTVHIHNDKQIPAINLSLGLNGRVAILTV